MPSTYLSLHYHIIFSTKERRLYLDETLRGRVHGYMGGILKKMDAIPEDIGGTEDHVLFYRPATHCLADVMRELKKNTSLWIHKEIGIHEFSWQDGYAAFTVSATARDGVRQYINHQEIHHRKKSFREELIEMLEMAGIEYDPQYLD